MSTETLVEFSHFVTSVHIYLVASRLSYVNT